MDLINNSQLTMANAFVEVIDQVDLAKVNELRSDTTGDIKLNKISDLKDNLANLNTFKDEEVTVLDNTVTIDLNAGVLDPDLSEATTINIKQVEVNLSSESQDYIAVAVVEFEDLSKVEIDNLFEK